MHGTLGHGMVPAVPLVVHAPTATAALASEGRPRPARSSAAPLTSARSTHSAWVASADRAREPVHVSTAARAATALLEVVLFVVSAGVGWLVWCATCVRSGRTPAMALCGQQALDRRSGQPADGLAAVYGSRSRTAVIHSRAR